MRSKPVMERVVRMRRSETLVWKKCNVFNGVEQTECSINFAVISSRVQMRYRHFR